MATSNIALRAFSGVLGAALLLAGGNVAAQSGGLKQGEYACYGSGGSLLIGLGFKVTDGSHYTDLDGKSAGTYAVSGGKVVFTGGHLAGETGQNLQNGRFVIGRSVSCEPFK